MKLAVLIPDGTGVRNFLCGRFVDLLYSVGTDICVWHCLPDEFLEPFLTRWGNQVRFKRLPDFREGLPERILRNAKLQAQLYWQDEPGLAVVLNRLAPQGRLVSKAVTRSARVLARLFASAAGVRHLHDLHSRVTLRAGYLQAFLDPLASENPDVVFCTHQRASRAVPAMLAARVLGIPTATFIYSWDNLPKGRMAVHADHFLVWSEGMRQEMGRYYPEVDTERIHVVGTPQFEFYRDDTLLEPRDRFLRGLGLSPERPVICFSGDDLTTSPFDPAYLRDVATGLREFPLHGRPQLVLRPCPTDNAERYRLVLNEFPEILLSRPKWQTCGGNDWTQQVPTPEDLALLVNLATHCNLVVNVGSTMAVDFAICGNPAIYLAYNPPEAAASPWRVDKLYELPHFGLTHSTNSVHWARSRQEIAALIRRILENPTEKQREREELVRRISAAPLSEASRRCCEALYRISGQPAKHLCTSAS